jgi:hypothetical protein
MKGVMIDPLQRKKRELHSGPPCPHYPHKYKTEAAHQGKLASRRRNHHRFMKTSLDYRLKQVLGTIRHRCESPKFIGYKYYGGKGIKNFLTLGDLNLLWVRDGADQMKRPTIDRRHSSLDYAPQNCQFIEHADNVRKARKAA